MKACQRVSMESIASAAATCRESLARSAPIQCLSAATGGSAPSSACSQTLLGGQAVDVAFDVEERVDAFVGLERDRRDRRAASILPARFDVWTMDNASSYLTFEEPGPC